ncbi:Cysteine-Rich Pdz-Binding Protein [Manis pentadactyla]|nr:Cysteine-Rich Pdz-Binding Protein [Manis pentadactyla]
MPGFAAKGWAGCEKHLVAARASRTPQCLLRPPDGAQALASLRVARAPAALPGSPAARGCDLKRRAAAGALLPKRRGAALARGLQSPEPEAGGAGRAQEAGDPLALRLPPGSPIRPPRPHADPQAGAESLAQLGPKS